MPIFLAVLAVLAAVVTPAFAAETRFLETGFGPDGTAATAFGKPGPVAIDQSTGSTYVVDFNTNAVERFNSAHEPEPFTGISPNIVGGHLTGFSFSPQQPSGVNELAVNSSSHVLYVLGFNSPLQAFAQDGEPSLFTAGPGAGTNKIPGSELCGVAVDSSGAIYASEAARVKIYAPSGAELAGIPVEAVCNLAVDSTGAVYLTHFNGPVEKWVPSTFPVTLSTTYEAAGVLDERSSSALTIDPATNHVFVDERTRIVEYEPDGKELLSFGASDPGALANSEGVAVNSSTARAYVSDLERERQVEIFGPAVTVPDVITDEATNLTSASGQATLNGSVNPDGVLVSSCEFEYGTTTAYGASAKCSPAPGSATEPVPVTATITGLTPATVYHYRLIAANANGSNPGADRTFTAPGVALASQWASKVTATSANLHAEINPNGVSTTYRFEYGTTTSYGHTAPIPDGQAGAGAAPVSVEVHVPELQPNTTYHYRVVATGLGTETGPDQTFLTQPATGEGELPDGRQWELVSPPDKHGAGLLSIGVEGLIQASGAGDRLTYLATAPTEPEPEGNASTTQVLSTRTGSGWGSRDISIPRTTAEGLRGSHSYPYEFFSNDLSLSVAVPAGPFLSSLSPEASEQTPYLRSDYSGGREVCPTAAQKAGGVSCYRPLVTGKPGYANVPEGNIFTDEAEGGTGGPGFAGATPDLSHIIVSAPYLLTTPGKTSTPTPGLYEWFAGKLTPIAETTGFQAVSSDGARVVFLTHPGVNDELQVRDVALGQTLHLDSPEAECLENSTCGEGAPQPVFQGVSADGTKVFFTDTQRLTPDAGHAGADLYECVLIVNAGALGCQLHDLTPPGAAKEDANVQGNVLGMSSDGSTVYFVATGVLTETENVQRTKALPGATNLYVRHGGATSLVAVLRGDDRPDWDPPGATGRPTRVSSSGEWLAFMSDASLTGYDNRDVASGKLDEEVFLFHAATGALVCASCNPTGARPAGVEYAQIETKGDHDPSAGGFGVFDLKQWVAANVPNLTPYKEGLALYQSRYLSESGRLFFNSSDALAPQDVNHTEDVYQYEPPAIGGCSTASVTFSAAAGGCVALISSGKSSEESEFLDASETGGDVFFLTSTRLQPSQDFDTSVDVYDARECTSASPCIPVAASQPPPCGNGDACKPTPSPQPPIFGASGSATFSGSGNPPPQPAGTVTKPLTKAQKLTKALRACRRQHGRRRVRCEREARARYAPHHKAKRSSHARPGGNG